MGTALLEVMVTQEHIARKLGVSRQLVSFALAGYPKISPESRARIKSLTPQTRRDNARFFGREADVPHHVLTMGVGTILEARQVLLLAFSRAKARAIAEAVEGPVTASNSASALQLHPVAKVCLDEPAASRLQRADYYRWVYDHKPAWQTF